MQNILIFKTSSDNTMYRLFQELGKRNIDCLIQSSQMGRYQVKYPYINFIDIQQEGFYNLSSEIITQISSKVYAQLYVTFSGTKGYNYGNVMELVDMVNFKSAFFYNCNGDKVRIPKKNVIKDMLCRLYVKWIGFVYGLRGG